VNHKPVRRPKRALPFQQAQARLLALIVTGALLAMACSSVTASAFSEPARAPVEEAASASGNRIRFEHLSLEQGLSQSSVLCMLQDGKGFMWFGTWDGLNKYDGYNFTVYKYDPEDPYSLSDNTVWSMVEDRLGVLWIGTRGGLNQFDRETGHFVRYQHDPGDPTSLSDNLVYSIAEDRSGALWVGTEDGLNRFERDTGRFTRYRNDPDDPHSLSNNAIRSIYEDRSGVLWIGTRGGLNRFDRATGHFVRYRPDPDAPYSLSGDTIAAIYEDQAGVLWIGTASGGLNQFDRETGRFTHYWHAPNEPHSLSSDAIAAIYEDRSGALWVGTSEDGLNQFDRESEAFIRYRHDPGDPGSLSNDRVWSIYEDRSGVLWIGTNGGGLNTFDVRKRGFVRYQHDPGDPNSLGYNDVLGLCEDPSGALWIGTAGGGLDRLERETGQFTHYRNDPQDPYSLSGDFVVALYVDRAGVLWAGTYNQGLNRFDQETGHFVHYQHNPGNPHSLSDNAVYSIYEERSGAFWIGTLGGGLDRLERGTETFTHYKNDPNDPHSLSDDHVRSICEDPSGDLWVGTDKGLNKFERATGQFIHYQHDPDDPNSLGDDFVLSVHQDRSGVLWIGTDGGGLDKLVLSDAEGFDPRTETFMHYREEDGLPNSVVYGILEDEQGHLWLSTNKGIAKFDPRTGTFKNYDVKDGLQSNEFNGGSYYQSNGGEMFFGGVNGLTAFYPQNIQDNPYVPPIVLTSLTQGGEDVGTGTAAESVKEVTLRWPNNFFEFEFAALSYSRPEKNQYAYVLKEFDKDWNYVGTRRFGKYTNLPGGTYTLRLKGSNSDSIWNEEGILVKVTIVPPFWGTWWFRGAVALVLVGSVIGGYRWRVRNVEARSRELEMQVEERTHALEQRTQELEERTRETERRRQELEALYRADEELRRHLRLDEVLQALVDIAVDVLQADKSAVLVWDGGGERLVTRVARGFSSETMACLSFVRGEGSAGHVAASGQPVVVEDVRSDPRCESERPEVVQAVLSSGVHSFMHLPIQIKSDVFGVFNVSYTRPHAFGEDEQRLFTALAQRAALAIENAQLYEQAQQLAVVEERGRLARDLHDAVTQTLFSSSLIAEALPTLWESDQKQGRQLLKELRQLSRGALAEMRTLLLELRPTALVEANLGDLLRQLAEAVTGRTGIPVTVALEHLCALPSEAHVALYRIAQEALNNVVKHANARHVEVSLRCVAPPSPSLGRGAGGEGASSPFQEPVLSEAKEEGPGVRASSPLPGLGEGPGVRAISPLPGLGEGPGVRAELRVSDDGCGFDAACIPPDRLGLGIIRERAQAIGATLQIESQPGRGTQIVVTWEEKRRRQ